MTDDNDVPVIEDTIPADLWADAEPGFMRTKDSDWLAQKMAEFEQRGGRVQTVAMGVTTVPVAELGMDTPTKVMHQQSQKHNEERQARKLTKEPERLAKILEVIASGVRGHANVARAAGVNGVTLREIREKYGIEIPLIERPQRKERRRNEHDRGTREGPATVDGTGPILLAEWG